MSAVGSLCLMNTVEFSLCLIWGINYFEFEIKVAETEDEF